MASGFWMIDLALEALSTSGLTYGIVSFAVLFILVHLVSNFRSSEPALIS